MNKKDSNYCLRLAKKIKAIQIMGGKCEKCGCNAYECLEFHHKTNKTDKLDNLSRMIGNERWSKIELEIKKCVLLCANCHMELHCGQAIDKRREELKLKLLEYKNAFCCSECGYKGKNYSSLDFHHSNEKKNYEINELVWGAKGKKRTLTDKIMHELDLCCVICRNCHRKKHFNYDRFFKNRNYIFELIDKHVEKNEVNRKEIEVLIKNGVKSSEISRRLKCAKSTVSYIKKKLEKDAGNSIIN